MRVLFLDIDGVLNSTEFFKKRETRIEDLDRNAVGILNDLVEQSKCLVVISSCWRHNMDKLRSAMINAGAIFEPREYTPCNMKWGRGQEIQGWMDKYDVRKMDIVILDDDTDMLHLADRLIETSVDIGLQREHITEAMDLWNPKSTNQVTYRGPSVINAFQISITPGGVIVVCEREKEIYRSMRTVIADEETRVAITLEPFSNIYEIYVNGALFDKFYHKTV